MSKKACFQFAEANQFLAPASVEVSRYFPDCQEGATSAEEKSTWECKDCPSFLSAALLKDHQETGSCDCANRPFAQLRIAFKPSQQ